MVSKRFVTKYYGLCNMLLKFLIFTAKLSSWAKFEVFIHIQNDSVAILSYPLILVVLMSICCLSCVHTEDIKFADTPTELRYSIGSSALLECVATGQPIPSVSWRFNRRKITPG